MSKSRRQLRRLQRLERLREEIAKEWPTLSLLIDEQSDAEVRGTFPVRGENGRVIDSFQVSIRLPRDMAQDLPKVRETGGRIPWTMNRHVLSCGTACVLLPDDRWRVFPKGSTFTQYLRGPLHSFFLGQLYYEIEGKWPFGEWGHGKDGKWEHYFELLKTTDKEVVVRFLFLLSDREVLTHKPCPCGSGKRIALCCHALLRDLRAKIDRTTALFAWGDLADKTGSAGNLKVPPIAGAASVLRGLAGTVIGARS